MSESSLIIIIVKDVEQVSPRAFMVRVWARRGREVISLQKVDSLLVLDNVRKLKRFLRHNGEGFR
jgi:hypothetical protein